MKNNLILAVAYILVTSNLIILFCLKQANKFTRLKSAFFNKNQQTRSRFKLVFLSVSLISFPCFSVAESVDQQKLLKIEAAYLYKFTKFIKWPEFRFQDSSNLNICLVGEDLSRLNKLLTRGISGKQSNGRTLQIYHYQSNLISTNTNNCHLIYLNQYTIKPLEPEFDVSSTLVISAPNNTNALHSLISLHIDSGKLIFSVNQEILSHSLLEINAALLSLARKK